MQKFFRVSPFDAQRSLVCTPLPNARIMLLQVRVTHRRDHPIVGDGDSEPGVILVTVNEGITPSTSVPELDVQVSLHPAPQWLVNLN